MSLRTLKDAMQLLAATSSSEQIQAVCEKVDAGFLADIPTIHFADSDWVAWNEAIRNKVDSLGL